MMHQTTTLPHLSCKQELLWLIGDLRLELYQLLFTQSQAEAVCVSQKHFSTAEQAGLAGQLDTGALP